MKTKKQPQLQAERVLAYQICEVFTIEDLKHISGGNAVGRTGNAGIEYTSPSRIHDIVADINVDW